MSIRTLVRQLSMYPMNSKNVVNSRIKIYEIEKVLNDSNCTSAITIISRNSDKLLLVIRYEQCLDAVANDKMVYNDAWTKQCLKRLEYTDLY